MVAGASTADIALILVDVRRGVVEQSRRHALLASLLGVRHLVVCVNKMDLVDWSEDAFERVREEFSAFASRLNVHDLTFVPGVGAVRRQRRGADGAGALVRRRSAACAVPESGVLP